MGTKRDQEDCIKYVVEKVSDRDAVADDLRKLEAVIRSRKAKLRDAEEELRLAVYEAVRVGVPTNRVASETGYSRGKVRRIAGLE